MSETEWTISTLKEFLESRLNNVDRQLEDVHRDVARVSDRMPHMLSRTDYEPRHRELESKIDTLSTRVERIEVQKETGRDSTARLMGVIAVLASVAGVIVIVIQVH